MTVEVTRFGKDRFLVMFQDRTVWVTLELRADGLVDLAVVLQRMVDGSEREKVEVAP